MMIADFDSALLVVNRHSGTGRTQADLRRLEGCFNHAFAPIRYRRFLVAENHDDAWRLTRRFLAFFRGPGLLLVGGGGGTARAVAQGLLEAAEAGTVSPETVRVGALRLGSGNLVARHLGIPADPAQAMRQVAANLFAGRSAPSYAFSCSWRAPSGEAKRLYALALGGVGPLARVPGDVHDWKQRHRRLIRQAAGLIPLEQINFAQYAAFSLLAAARCLVHRQGLMEVTAAGRTERVHALAGLLVKADFPGLPLRAACAAGEPKLEFCVVPVAGRVLRYVITPEAPLQVRFPNSRDVVVALDEDLFTLPPHLTFEVAACMHFVPGNSHAIHEVVPGRDALRNFRTSPPIWRADCGGDRHDPLP